MIYLDYAATTPIAPEVFAAMRPWMEADGEFGNPASAHAAGLRARAAVEEARAQVATLIGAQPDEIIWTSGATESNNLAIKGVVEFSGNPRTHLITSRIEHKCVLDTCRWLETRGISVTYLKPDAKGRIDHEAVLAQLRPETLLVSLMWVNNETGVIQDVEALAPRLRERGVLLHVDAAQAAGKLSIDLQRTPVDLLSLSAHKLYGPKGMGALFVRRRPRVRLSPQLHGGGHEFGMRSGTLPTHQIVGMGMAFALANREMNTEMPRLTVLRERLFERLSGLPSVHRNGEAALTAPHLLNMSFGGVEGESLRAGLYDLAVSSGAACSSATAEPSYVLRALGRNDELANASLRFSFGRVTTEAEIDAAALRVIEEVQRLRRLAPDTPVMPCLSSRTQ
jgi:cysteine desulfurase